ncbi:hypothetical protein E4U21_000091 [Claviceps maximensis]|nr:hypothetical protein E4U21_000091 [Claviceps maximensis]
MARRRHRLFIVVAAAIIFLLYRVSQNSWDAQQLKPVALKEPQRQSEALDDVIRKVIDDETVDVAKSPTVPDDRGTGADGKQQLPSNPGAKGRPKNNVYPVNDVGEKPLGQTDDTRPREPSSHEIKPSHATHTKVSWKKPKEHFPLLKKSIVALPAGPAKDVPRIQHNFSPEAEASKTIRLQRQSMVREEIQRAWAGYKQYAWMHDELSPVSNRSRDPFCGWAATLVDSLDTLWIAGLMDEFDEAALAARTIDFTYTSRRKIPIFETTIRYLGGLIAAYDVSGGASGRYSFLLDKAVELAEILMGIFDTPNRMPVLYYYWSPEDTSRPRRAGEAGMAELATLSLEFTRLAQVTGQHKYYDAIDRITNALIDLQRSGTSMPGLFPQNLDISGCNTTAKIEQNFKSIVPRAQMDSEGRLEESSSDASQMNSAKAKSAALEEIEHGDDPEFDCVSQGVVPVNDGYQSYHMGGAQDSAYEYFSKEYLLLGGREKKYQKLYEDTVDGINKHLLYRPMIPGDWDIIFPAKVGIHESTYLEPNIEYEVTHLTCFIGGMYALGGKLFGREKDVKYAEKLTNGCVWAYQSTASGIMPEDGSLVPCPTFKKCSFNETLWWQTLDPFFESRDQLLLDWEMRNMPGGQGQGLQQEAEPQEQDMVRTDNLRGTSSAPEKANALAKRGIVPPAPSDPDVAAEKKLDDGASGSQARNEHVTEEKFELPNLEEDYHHSRPRPPRDPNSQPHHGKRFDKPLSHEEYVQSRIEQGIPKGYSTIGNKKYILRPEAIESVWYMYRITGDASWMEKGWTMFEATMKATKTSSANTAIGNVLSKGNNVPLDEMESFWLAETLKYYYLLFSEPSVISLDEWVLNTEAHPFKLETTT